MSTERGRRGAPTGRARALLVGPPLTAERRALRLRRLGLCVLAGVVLGPAGVLLARCSADGSAAHVIAAALAGCGTAMAVVAGLGLVGDRFR